MAKAKKEKVPARHVVVISRNWDNPEINISITDMMIAIAMKMPAFKKALALELEATTAEKTRLNAAIDRVLSKMKSETARGDVILPISKAEERHNIGRGALDCWCSPRYLLPCDECDDGCWKCDGGSTEITREEAEKTNAAIIIVHQEEEG